MTYEAAYDQFEKKFDKMSQEEVFKISLKKDKFGNATQAARFAQEYLWNNSMHGISGRTHTDGSPRRNTRGYNRF